MCIFLHLFNKTTSTFIPFLNVPPPADHYQETEELNETQEPNNNNDLQPAKKEGIADAIGGIAKRIVDARKVKYSIADTIDEHVKSKSEHKKPWVRVAMGIARVALKVITGALVDATLGIGLGLVIGGTIGALGGTVACPIIPGISTVGGTAGGAAVAGLLGGAAGVLTGGVTGLCKGIYDEVVRWRIYDQQGGRSISAAEDGAAGFSLRGLFAGIPNAWREWRAKSYTYNDDSSFL